MSSFPAVRLPYARQSSLQPRDLEVHCVDMAEREGEELEWIVRHKVGAVALR